MFQGGAYFFQSVLLAADKLPPLLFRYEHVVIALMAYILTDWCVSACIRIGHKLGAEDKPGTQDYKVQKQATPFLGGFGLFTGFFLALLTTLDWDTLSTMDFSTFWGQEGTRVAAAILIGGLATAFLGLIDDFKPIHAGIKLAVLTAITLVLVNLNLYVDVGGIVPLRYIITLLWIVGVTSAFNAIDNTDGVAGTTALSVCAFSFMIAWGTSAADAQPVVTYIAVALGAATLGFLRHNRPTARIYLGNAGSFSLGFYVAVMAIHNKWTPNNVESAIAPALLVLYPLFDLGYTTFMRWRAGVVRNIRDAIVVSGRDHTAHRLSAMGFNTWWVIVIIAGLNAVGGFGAFAITRYNPSTLGTIGIVAGVVAVYSGFGWWIRNAVDLHTSQARLSHRRPVTGLVDKSDSQRHETVASGRD